MQQLATVYNNNQLQIGVFEERRKQRITLLPVSHVMQSAQIEILITEEGEFKNAKVIDKEHARTIVPATTASANRANASAPHYIHDKLQYVAQDFIQFGGSAKRKQHHIDYMNQMKTWAESESAPRKVKSVYAYVSKGTVVEDLIKHNILPVDAHNKVIEKWTFKEDKPPIYKVVTGDALSAFVRFDVIHQNADDPVIWEDTLLFDNFIKFLDCNADYDTGVCYVTNKNTTLTSQHGSRLRNAGDMSKLISANDHTGYTYRGRFKKPTEAVQIGYDVSQKAHHALRWLIQRQGSYVDSRYFISFGVERPSVTSPLLSTAEIFEDDVFASYARKSQKTQALTEDIVAEELNKAIQGMKHTLNEEKLENIIVIALDAATRGRLAVVYYQHFRADLYYEAILNWHQTCHWLQIYKDKDTNKIMSYVGTPSTSRISEAVYGSKADSRIKKELYTRLLPCIVERKPIPKDIVRTIFNRIKNPFSFQSPNDSWNATLNIACALINKQYESEGYTVTLQTDNRSRDYLFGRLLGIAEVMERHVLDNRGEKRSTNAMRYFNAFAQHPSRTWMVIRKQLAPYFESSSANTRYYNMLIQQVEDKIDIEYMTDDALDPLFLLGYSSQIQDMYTKKEEKENDSIKA